MQPILQTFNGEHCETTAIGAVLASKNIYLSEEMLFGLGQGLGYICMKFGKSSFPFIGGRIKTALVLQNLCTNLGLTLKMKRTASVKKAWENVKLELDQGHTVGLQLDSYYLDYFTKKVHFAGHFIAMHHYDDQYAYVVDTYQQGKFQKTTLENLALARNSKQPMADKNMSFTIDGSIDHLDMHQVLKHAIRANAYDYLNPPIRNFGYKGIEKTACELAKYYEASTDISHDFGLAGMLMEKAGTGGSLFRNIYSRFLQQANDTLQLEQIVTAQKLFDESAALWYEVSILFTKISENASPELLTLVSTKLQTISQLEFKAMSLLSTI